MCVGPLGERWEGVQRAHDTTECTDGALVEGHWLRRLETGEGKLLQLQRSRWWFWTCLRTHARLVNCSNVKYRSICPLQEGTSAWQAPSAYQLPCDAAAAPPSTAPIGSCERRRTARTFPPSAGILMGTPQRQNASAAPCFSCHPPAQVPGKQHHRRSELCSNCGQEPQGQHRGCKLHADKREAHQLPTL